MICPISLVIAVSRLEMTATEIGSSCGWVIGDYFGRSFSFSRRLSAVSNTRLLPVGEAWQAASTCAREKAPPGAPLWDSCPGSRRESRDAAATHPYRGRAAPPPPSALERYARRLLQGCFVGRYSRRSCLSSRGIQCRRAGVAGAAAARRIRRIPSAGARDPALRFW